MFRDKKHKQKTSVVKKEDVPVAEKPDYDNTDLYTEQVHLRDKDGDVAIIEHRELILHRFVSKDGTIIVNKYKKE